MNHKAKKILVVDDDRKIALALAIRLQAAGYAVLTAPNGLEGLRQTVHERPDLILMDIWMPIGLGFSVAQRLSHLGLQNIPIIFITGSKVEGLRETAQELGAVDFFEKPYNSTDLLEAVSRNLAKQKCC